MRAAAKATKIVAYVSKPDRAMSTSMPIYMHVTVTSTLIDTHAYVCLFARTHTFMPGSARSWCPVQSVRTPAH